MGRKSKNFRITHLHKDILNPKVNFTLLNNGLLVVTEEVPFFNSFALGIGVKAGSRDDYINKEGLSHLVEHCLFRRTKNFVSRQINELFEKYGAYANAYTTKEYTAFYVRALNHNLEKVWELLSEIVFEPNFIKNDIDKEKSIIREEIRSYNDDPEEEIIDITDKYLFQNTRLDHPIVGKISTLNKIDIKDIQKFYSEFYQPSNIVIAYIGNTSHQVIVSMVERKIANIKTNSASIVRNIRPISNNNFRVVLKRQFLQSHISITRSFQFNTSRERYLAAISNLLLGDCASSRLYKSIREKNALAYNIYSLFTSYSDCSAIYIYSTANPKKQEKTINFIFEELENIYDYGFSENELILAKEQIKSSTIMAFENYSERLQAIIKSELTYGNYESLQETIELIESITLEELNSFVKKLFNPNDWSTLVFQPK
ncbi:MAG: insulinase family protein [Ignavibacteria bacterium]|nr:insulinase family protein [Ignavibacteria bacterium]